jgi:hypothetical protein
LGVKNAYAASEYSFSQKQLPLLNKFSNGIILNLSAVQLSKIDSGDSDYNSFSQKGKRNKKGLLPVLICPTNESHLILIAFEIRLVCFPKVFYFFCPDFVHEDRGPPFSSIVS